MNTRPILLLTAILYFAGGAAPPFHARAGESSQAEALTLTGAVARGLSNSPALKAVYERHQAALHRIPQAASLPDPQVNFNFMIEHVQTRTGPQENMFAVSQTIPWFGKLRLREEAASGEARAALQEYENERLELIREISAAYFEYAYLAKDTAITTEILELIEQQQPVVSERVRAGGAYTDKLRLELEEGRIRDKLVQLESQRHAASARLRAAMGETPGDSDSPLPWPSVKASGLQAASLETLSSSLTANHPMLAALEEKAGAAAKKTELARRNIIPDPTIGANLVEIGDGGKDAYGITVGFRIPLWFGKYKAEREEAKAVERSISAERSEMENRLLAELAAAYQDFTAAIATVKRYESTLLPSADEVVEISQTTYSTGELTLLEWIDAEEVALDVRLTYWRALTKAHAALIRLQTLTGDDDL